MKKLALSLAVSTLAMSASAMDPMPPEAGFSGFLAAGASGGQVESNFLAKILSIDLSNKDIYKYDSPDQTDIIIPSFGYNFGYTFADTKTRIYIGTAVENSLDFSSNTVVAVRHDFDSIGNVELAGLAPGAAKLEVWENPYQLGSNRSSTERTTSGGRITWDKIFGTDLEFIANVRKVDIDDERSGEGLGLTQAQQKLLDREGDVTRIELGYAFNFAKENLMVRPSAAYIDRDLDGNAMAQDGYELGVSLTYDGGKYVWMNRAAYQSLNGDETNPIFNEKNDADVYMLASEIRVPDPFGWENWFTTVGVQWADNRADIDFNKSSVAMFSAHIGRRF
ncbi:Uncharacterised protein [Halioglobus japonicus]|nr:Uncharacterised protein [Halioglobus japonicus]